MYTDFFGLKERPFSITPDIAYLYLGKQQERVLDTFLYAINQKMGFFLLTGEVGAGKTTLTRALLARLGDSVKTALLINPILSVEELLKAITKDFGIYVRMSTPQRQIDALNKFLLKNVENGKNALVVVDEAQNLSIEALEVLRMLTNLETDKTKLLQIMLVGQPELLHKLKKHEMRQLEQRITTRFHMTPFSEVEMCRYVNHRLNLAGGHGKVFFDSKAYKLLFKKTKGYPRLINILCDRALIAAFVKENYIIDKQAMKAAIRDWQGSDTSRRFGFLRRLVFS